MTVGKLGAARMFGILGRSSTDIRHRLWSLYWLLRMTHTEDGVAVELGTRGGDSTRALLAACLDCGAELFSFDVEDCSHSVDDPVLKERWHFFKGDSVFAGTHWGGNAMADLIFVDTDHTFLTTKNETAAWMPHLRRGGCMVFHDYWLYDPPRDENQGRGVKMAVDEFTNADAVNYRLETHDAGPEGDTGLALVWKL